MKKTSLPLITRLR